MKESHSLFLIFLLLIAVLAVVALSLHGWEYYLTPLEARPFHSEYSTLKPSGSYGHGLGIVGTLMVIIGVSTYSTRKRIRSLWNLGKLSRWLEFHIFLCLLGPILVIYHTTFKAGGIASISLWTMLSVAASGIIGRFLYTLVPRNLNGNELTLEEINSQLQELGSSLQSSTIGKQIVQMIDDAFANISKPKSLSETFSTFMHLQSIKSHVKHNIHRLIGESNLSHDVAKQMTASSYARASLFQKSLVLSQVERIFFYWHAIHLPFTIIMFITLAAHVVVVVMLGYRWIL
ncbi:MAG: hypothetical protein HYZ34_02605 [Ignavibacteriae bacterium]|nr:hypothetical protein [Ignavibacteriota bacterium]